MIFRNKLLFVLVMLNTNIFAQNTQILPDDPEFRVRKLSNGFTYYIKQAEKGSGKVNIKLLVKAGSLQEDPDQREQAHLLEHIGYKGTRNFPKGVYHYMSPWGLTRGVDMNATSGYNATNFYIHNLPVNEKEAFRTAIHLLRDIMDNLLIRPEDIKIEGEAVVAESRMGLSWASRLRNVVTPRLLRNTDYVKIARANLLSTESFKESSIIRYYKHWYHPSNSCIIVTGDINDDEVENIIKTVFSNIKRENGFRTTATPKAFAESNNQLMVFRDEEIHDVLLQIYHKQPVSDDSSLDLKEAVISKLYNLMMQKYFDELYKRYNPNATFAAHTFHTDGLVDGYYGLKGLMTYIKVDSLSQLKSTTIQVAKILNGLAKYGFSQLEFDLAKKQVIEASLHTKESRNTLERVATNHFLYEEPLITDKLRMTYERKILDEVSLSDVNSFVAAVINKKNRDITICIPQNTSEKAPSLKILESWLSLKADKKPSAPLTIQPKLIPITSKIVGKIKKNVYIKSIDATEIEFENGIRVVLKNLNGASDNKGLILTGFSKNGIFDYNLQDQICARYASEIVLNSGIANLNKFELEEFLKTKRYSVKPYIESYSSGMVIKLPSTIESGELEEVCMLISQYFLSPRKSEDAFNDWKRVFKKTYKELAPLELLTDSINRALGKENAGPGFSQIDQLNCDRVYQIYREVFNASDFTFVLTGNFSQVELLPILEKYLGAIDSSKKPHLEHQYKTTIRSQVSKTVYGNFKYPEVMLRLTGSYLPSLNNKVNLHALSYFLRANLNRRLREKEKGVYYVFSGADISSHPKGNYVFEVNYGTTLKNLDKHLSATIDEIEKLRTNLLSEDEIQLYIQKAKSRRIENLQKSSFWSGELKDLYLEDGDLGDILNFKSAIEKLSPESIRETALKYFSDTSLIQFLALPIKSR